jgi:hypothetical protein
MLVLPIIHKERLLWWKFHKLTIVFFGMAALAIVFEQYIFPIPDAIEKWVLIGFVLMIILSRIPFKKHREIGEIKLDNAKIETKFYTKVEEYPNSELKSIKHVSSGYFGEQMNYQNPLVMHDGTGDFIEFTYKGQPTKMEVWIQEKRWKGIFEEYIQYYQNIIQEDKS